MHFWVIVPFMYYCYILIASNSMVSDIDADLGLVCFEPDLTYFKYRVSCYYSYLISGTDNQWIRFCTLDQFVDYCHFVLRAYAHLTHNEKYQKFGFATDSIGKIKTITGSILIPTYILDMIREICRVMYTDARIDVVAYFPLNQRGLGLCPGIGYKAMYHAISSSLDNWFQFCSLSPLVQENPGKSPIFVTTDKNMAYANGSTCHKSRLESVNQLRFLRASGMTYYLGYKAKTSISDASVAEAYELEPYKKLVHSSEAYPDRRSYDTIHTADSYMYDASGTRFNMIDFLQAHDLTNILVATTREIDGKTFFSSPTPIVEFKYGVIGPEQVHRILSAITLKESDFDTSKSIRSKLSIGIAFSYPTVDLNTPFIPRFPSLENPSLLSRPGPRGKGVKTGKRRKNGKRKKKSKSLSDKDVKENGTDDKTSDHGDLNTIEDDDLGLK